MAKWAVRALSAKLLLWEHHSLCWRSPSHPTTASKTATSPLVKVSKKQDSQAENEKSAAPPISRHIAASPESRGWVLHLSYSPWWGEQAHFSRKAAHVWLWLYKYPASYTHADNMKERAAPSKAIVNTVVAVWPGISARAKSSSRVGCEQGLVCLDLDSNLKPYQRR